MTLNRELFVEDPSEKDIPNLGVSKVGNPVSDAEWAVLRYELASFVCDGQYESGLDRILSTFIANIGKQQPAAWISGFYGSGKSHLVRVLEYLWRDVHLPDGVSSRDLVDVSDRIGNTLRELSTEGKRSGGLWSAAGTLGSGAGNSVRLSFLSILFRSAGLPEHLPPALCAMWLKNEKIYDAVAASVSTAGSDLGHELRNLYVSTHLASAILEAMPDFASSAGDVRKQLRAQYPEKLDVTDADLLAIVTDVLQLVTTQSGKMPCALVVLDEMQQFISEDPDRALSVQNLVELCSSQFDGRLLVVATGQSALQSTATLQKLTDRFNTQIQLSDADVESVIRKVILRKRADKIGELATELSRVSGEIDRQLAGAKIAPIPDDQSFLGSDYPLLPSRRRFWEEVLRAVDKGGKAGQLRTQLKVVHEANRAVAQRPIGTVVPADFIYDQQTAGMLQTGVLLREIEELVQNERANGAEGHLRARILSLVFLISQLSREGFADTGVRPTSAHIADLLVDDLASSGEALRRDVPKLLEELRAESKLQRVEDEYQLQTRVGQEWAKDYQSRLNAFLSDTGEVASARERELREVVKKTVPTSKPQGASKTSRPIVIHFGDIEPSTKDTIVFWVRSGWDISRKQLIDAATGAGQDSSMVFVHLPKHEPDAFRQALGELSAAEETLATRARPTTAEGLAAQSAMESAAKSARTRVDALVREVVRSAEVVQAGGNQVAEGDLRGSIDRALDRALDRAYYRFSESDNAGWGTVVSRAQQGNADPLGAVGYSGDAINHPVCKTIAGFVSSTGISGADVRKHFESVPFGWSRDAVHGGLLALLTTGEITAEDSGAPVTARDINPTRIGKLTFRREDATVTLETRMAVRQVLTKAGIPYENNEEAVACALLLQTLGTLAIGAGGEPPLPPTPSRAHLDVLRARKGNDLLVAVANQRETLLQDYADWSARAKLRQPRLDAYGNAKRLATYCEDVEAAAPVLTQLGAILSDRLLLADPDPVPPVTQAMSHVLRGEVDRNLQRLAHGLSAVMNDLDADLNWGELTSDQRLEILRRHELVSAAEPDLSTTASLLVQLNQRPLSSWDDRIQALPARLEAAREAAAKIFEPKAVKFSLPKATLRSEEDVVSYVSGLRDALSAACAEHGSIIV